LQSDNVSVIYSEKLKRLYISEKVLITDEFHLDPEIENHVLRYTEELNKQLDLQAGFSDVDLEARFSRVRTEETNLGNMIADLCKSEFNTDFALTNGGNLRANHIFSRGPLKWKFLT